MSSSKKLTSKGTLRQLFIRVYRLEIQWVMLVFSTQLCELLLLSPSLWFNSPPPFPVWISTLYTLYTYTVCKGGGYGDLGLKQINTCRKVPSQVNCLRCRHFAVSSMSLIFLRCLGNKDFKVKRQLCYKDNHLVIWLLLHVNESQLHNNSPYSR